MSGSPVGQAGEEVAVPVEVDVVLPSTDDQGAKKRPSGRATVKIDYENEDEVCADGRVYKRVKNDYQKDDEGEGNQGRFLNSPVYVGVDLDSSSDDEDKEGANVESGPVAGKEPKDWKEVVQNIRDMRLSNPAPVDTMGCERTCDPSAEPKVQRFQLLVSLMLSSQTKDEVTYAAMTRLKDHGCTPEKMVDIELDELKKLLKPVGFYNKKAVNIKNVAELLLRNNDWDIPNTAESLMELPGVGPKMAFICMGAAWNITEGIGVDTHVHRISERLGWTKTGGKKRLAPEDTRKQLEDWMPKEMWRDINILLVGFGQTICNPTNPKCNTCLNHTLCPYGRQNVKKSK